MVKVDILGGLREALTRGGSLKEAMISFYNAGYSKEEIEEAARALQMQGPVDVIKAPEQKKSKSKSTRKKQEPEPIQRVSSYGPTTAQRAESLKHIKEGIDTAIGELEKIEFPNGRPSGSTQKLPVQNISGYVPKPKSKSKIAVALLIIFLILLLGVIASLFIFKDQLVEIINSSGFLSGIF